MHVCSIITSFTAGGAEVLAANLSAAFVTAGHQSTLLALCDAASVGNPPEYERAMKARVADTGGAVRSLRLANRRNLLAGAWAMRRAIGRIDPDIIHVHTAQALLLMLIAGIRRPTVYTHHNVRCNFPIWLFHAFDWIVDRYVAIGGACRKLLRAASRRPVILIRNGVPASFSASIPRKSLPRDPVLLGVGALTPQKDYPTLIRAAGIIVHEMAADGRSVRVQIAGGGEEMDRLRALVADLHLEDHVNLLGTRQDIPELMQKADLMVNSSIFEGLPIALIEAAMSALPIVATDVGGSGEVVEAGTNGFLVSPGDPDALAAAIMEALQDDARYAAMSLASANRSRDFTLESCAAAHLKLYASITRARPRRFWQWTHRPHQAK